MFDKIFRRKEQAKTPDVTVSLEIPKDVKERIDCLGADSARIVFKDYLKTVNRVQLLCVEDDPWFKKHKHHDYLIEVYNEEEWERQWPMGEYGYETRIPSIVMSTIPLEGLDKENPVDIAKLARQVEGIQKKLDKIIKLMESKEVTMSVKTALSL